MNSSLLQQIANPRPLKIPSPIETAMTGLQLKNMMQAGQMGDIQLQNAQQGQQDQAMARAQGLKIQEILVKNGGDIEKSLPEIGQVAPNLLPHYQKYVQETKKANQDFEQGAQSLANAKLTGQSTQQKMTIDAAAEQRTKDELTQKQQQEAAGVMVPGTEFLNDKQERSALFRVRTPEGTYKNEVRVLGKVGAPPQAPRIPVPGTDIPLPAEVEAQRGRISAAGRQPRVDPAVTVSTVDDKGQPVTRVLPRSQAMGQDFPQAPTAEERNRATATKKIDPILEGISELSEKINTGKGLVAKMSGGVEKVKAQANYNDDVAEYQALISGFTPMIARGVGHTGVLTQQDVDSVKEMFPKPGDSKTLRDRKIARLKTIIGSSTVDAPSAGGLDDALDKAFGKPK